MHTRTESRAGGVRLRNQDGHMSTCANNSDIVYLGNGMASSSRLETLLCTRFMNLLTTSSHKRIGKEQLWAVMGHRYQMSKMGLKRLSVILKSTGPCFAGAYGCGGQE